MIIHLMFMMREFQHREYIGKDANQASSNAVFLNLQLRLPPVPFAM
jgi:hypothetical protein